jgi:hypothetical protein
VFIEYFCTTTKQYGNIILKRIKIFSIKYYKVVVYNIIHLIAFITHLLVNKWYQSHE